MAKKSEKLEKQNKNKGSSSLYQAMLSMRTANEMACFMTDLCTPQELSAFGERWAIAQLLDDGALGYRDIAKITGSSTTTVARVARFLHHEHHGGYVTALERLGKKKSD